MTVVYKSDQTKFKDGTEEKSGCLFCSPDFIPLVEKHRAISSRPAHASSRGRGRGGGMGGDPAVGTGNTRGSVGGGRGSRGRPAKDKMAQLAAYFV